jgi:hypothetical protein
VFFSFNEANQVIFKYVNLVTVTNSFLHRPFSYFSASASPHQLVCPHSFAIFDMMMAKIL